MSAEPLQWDGCTARSETGRFTVWPYQGEWIAGYWDYLTSREQYLYRGPAESDAMLAAQSHHEATCRRLAWERYMAENDPPSNGEAL